MTLIFIRLFLFICSIIGYQVGLILHIKEPLIALLLVLLAGAG